MSEIVFVLIVIINCENHHTTMFVISELFKENSVFVIPLFECLSNY